MLAKGILSLVGTALNLFGEKGKRSQEAVKEMASNLQRTYTDECIVVYWFAPTLISLLFNFSAPMERQMQLAQADSLLFEVQVAITAAVFGLGKMVGRK